MRHAATYALLTRRDAIIVASVSCIYGIGAAEAYLGMKLDLARGRRGAARRRAAPAGRHPVRAQRRRLRARHLPRARRHRRDLPRLRAREGDPRRVVRRRDRRHLRGRPAARQGAAQDRRGVDLPRLALRHAGRPADARHDRHQGRAARAARPSSRPANKLVEEQRLQQRTLYDLEMLEQMGRCKGIENYSRHLSGRAPGEPPPTLLDYFPKDFLLFVDESHQTVPQIAVDVQRRPLAQGDAGRLRLPAAVGAGQPPAALRRVGGAHRRRRSSSRRRRPNTSCSTREGVVVEQIIRPTGLLDPEIEVRPVGSQVDDLLGEIRERVKMGERVLVTTLTKRMAEDLTEYYSELGVRVRYLHSDIDTLERIEILRDLRLGEFDVLVGINLLREGLDLPEVSLVGDPRRRQGGLPARRALADPDHRPRRPQRARQGHHVRRPRDRLDEEGHQRDRQRRATQEEYNAATASRPRRSRRRSTTLAGTRPGRLRRRHQAGQEGEGEPTSRSRSCRRSSRRMRKEMFDLSEALEFEKAAALRDRIKELEEIQLARIVTPVPLKAAPAPLSRRSGHAVQQAPDARPFGLALPFAARLGARRGCRARTSTAPRALTKRRRRVLQRRHRLERELEDVGHARTARRPAPARAAISAISPGPITRRLCWRLLNQGSGKFRKNRRTLPCGEQPRHVDRHVGEHVAHVGEPAAAHSGVGGSTSSRRISTPTNSVPASRAPDRSGSAPRPSPAPPPARARPAPRRAARPRSRAGPT